LNSELRPCSHFVSASDISLESFQTVNISARNMGISGDDSTRSSVAREEISFPPGRFELSAPDHSAVAETLGMADSNIINKLENRETLVVKPDSHNSKLSRARTL
jgi:hypothetical protein